MGLSDLGEGGAAMSLKTFGDWIFWREWIAIDWGDNGIYLVAYPWRVVLRIGPLYVRLGR